MPSWDAVFVSPMLTASEQESESSNFPTEPPYQSSKDRKSVLKAWFQYHGTKNTWPLRSTQVTKYFERDSYSATRVTELVDSFSTANRSHSNLALSEVIRSKAMFLITQNCSSRTEERIEHYGSQFWI